MRSVFALLFCSVTVLAQDRKPLLLEGKSSLFQKVLVRPYASLYDKPDGKKLEENLPAFSMYYVYAKPISKFSSVDSEGWYEVGKDAKGKIAGWLKAEDVMEWKQAMCLTYTHPTERRPVLMFRDLLALRNLLKSTKTERVRTAKDYYQAIQNKEFPESFPILGQEPADYVDIVEKFYLLPILEHSAFDLDGIEGRLLKITAAIRSGRAPENSKKAGFMSFSEPGNSSARREEKLRTLKLDVIYVIDMTGSMNPYIRATLKAVRSIERQVANPELADSIQFGLWGYQDAMFLPHAQFITKNFTPRLQSLADFQKTLSRVDAPDGVGGDYPEDMYSGVAEAMRNTKWTEDAVRIIVLIGDAPAHEPGHLQNALGFGARQLRNYANDNHISLVSAYIKNPLAYPFNPLAKAQFTMLSKNPGEKTPAYWEIDADNLKAFQILSDTIASSILNIVTTSKKGSLVARVERTSSHDLKEPVQAGMANLGHAALVQWLGKEIGVEAPADITAWVADRDLIDPDTQALEVRLLISKNELDSLKGLLEEVLMAGHKGLITGEPLFAALQSIPSAAARGGEQIRHAKTLARSGLIPEFLADLPYKSRLMSMNNELWSSWGIDQQSEFLNDLKAKLQFYAITHDNPKLWIALNQGDEPGEQVFPISLEMLP